MDSEIPDNLNLAILQELQRDARQTVQQIAERVGLSATPCWKRIKDMEAAGVITGYLAAIDRTRVGLHLMAMADVTLTSHEPALRAEFETAVCRIPHITRCVSLTGEADYALAITAPDIAAFDRFLQHTLYTLPGVVKVNSRIVLREVKAEARLPLDTLARAPNTAPRRPPRRTAALPPAAQRPTEEPTED